MAFHAVCASAISLLVVVCIVVTPARATCLSAVQALCLDATQKEQTVAEESKRDEIREHYFENITHYAKESPIVNLTQTQIDAILENYKGLFSANPPVAPAAAQYVYNGTIYNETATSQNETEAGQNGTAGGQMNSGSARRRKRQVQGNYLCPSNGVYEAIQFGIGNNGDVLQMVQMENLHQWVFEETCNGMAGGAASTICVERLRTVNAIVVNVDEAVQISMEPITVTCCSTRSDP